MPFGVSLSPGAGGAINENEDPGEGGAEACGKGESVVGRRGRAWRAGVRGSASRWSDGLDQEMDFSQPPFLPGSPEGVLCFCVAGDGLR